MVRRTISKPFFAIAVAVIWTAAVLGFSMTQETPAGTVKGFVTSGKTDKPIAEAWVYLTAIKDGNLDYSKHYTTRSDSKGYYEFADIPLGQYSISASGRAHSLEGNEELQVEEGKSTSHNLQLAPAQPYLNLYVHQRGWMTDEKPRVLFEGFTDSDEIEIELLRVDVDYFLNNSPGTIRSIISSSAYVRLQDIDHALELVENKTVKITKRDSEGIFFERMSLGSLEPGLYIIHSVSDDIVKRDLITVGDIGLVAKTSGQDTLAYVVRPDTGEPVAGATISVIRERTVDNGVTGQDGIWRRPLTTSGISSGDTLLVARKGDSLALLSSYTWQSDSNSLTIYTYTDRPIYRPGQKVQFKGIVREFVNDDYRVPAPSSVRVEVKDKRDTVVYSGELPLNRMGSFHGGFVLPKYAATGYYNVSCSYKGQFRVTSFDVAEYRKPEFSVSVKMPKRCVKGTRVKAKVKAEYYFGSPVPGATVDYIVTKSDYWFWPNSEDSDYYDWSYEDYGGYGETVTTGTIRTNEDGTADIEFTADWDTPKSEFASNDQQFTVNAVVTDASDRSAEGDGRITATQGEFRVIVEPEKYVVSPKQESRVRIVASDYDNRPQSGISLEIVAKRAEWYKGRERLTTEFSSKRVTDSRGLAQFSFRPKSSGSYHVFVTCVDRKGNPIREIGYLWVTSRENEDFNYNYTDLEIVLDKKVYKPGETAKVLINSKEKGGTALLTVEGRRIFDHKLVRLNSRSTVVEVPVKSEYKPNFFIGVCYVKDKKFAKQEARVRVSLGNQTLKVTVTPDKKKYKPGDKATYLIKTEDPKGKPVSAEVSLGVVDEAIYAIAEDSTTPILDYFYERQWNTVSTQYSFADVYLSGDKASYAGRVRKEFVDTAFWQPDITTNAAGEARVSFTMPDNLTTWRATARACTANTLVGQTTSTVVSSKDLIVRLDTPRFLRQKDSSIISATVHNYLPKAQQIAVRLDISGLETKDTQSVTVDVPSQGMKRVQWHVKAPKHGTARLTAYATCNSAQDAMQLEIPILPNGQKQTRTVSGSVSDDVDTQTIAIDPKSVAGASEIRIRLAPSIASAMLGSLDYLAAYPYGCAEQTMSCLLPDVMIVKTMKDLGISNPGLEQRLPDMVGTGLSRLYDMQNWSGGWGWGYYSENNTWMTAYVVYGLLQARSAGFQVNQDVVNSGIGYLKDLVQAQKNQSHTQLYALYVLSIAGENELVRQKLVAIDPETADSSDLAYLAMTLANVGYSADAHWYLSHLWDRAKVDSLGIHWVDKKQGWNDTDNTATALTALVRLTPDDSRISQVINWLLMKRTFNHWASTRDTAAILYALSEHLSRTGELQPDFTCRISLNGREHHSVEFDRSSVFQPEKEVVISGRDIAQGSNSLEIEVSGEGRLYYTVETVQYVENPEPTTTGITVSRSYHKLVPRLKGSYGGALVPEKRSTNTFRVGDIIQVKLVVKSDEVHEYVMVEDYLPAGFEPIDRGKIDVDYWTDWWVDKDVRDDRVSFYVETLKRGISELTYNVRVSTRGAFHAVPAAAQAMYEPDVYGSGSSQQIRIR